MYAFVLLIERNTRAKFPSLGEGEIGQYITNSEHRTVWQIQTGLSALLLLRFCEIEVGGKV